MDRMEDRRVGRRLMGPMALAEYQAIVSGERDDMIEEAPPPYWLVEDPDDRPLDEVFHG